LSISREYWVYWTLLAKNLEISDFWVWVWGIETFHRSKFSPATGVRWPQYSHAIFLCPRSNAGVPFDSVRRFRSTLLLYNPCMRLWGNWVASCEIMSQHFHIWRVKQTIQGLWPNFTWRDKQNQGKDPVFESKTGKPNCILHKNSSLDFIQTYTSRRVAYLCIFLYMKSLSSEFHRDMHTSDIQHHLPLNNY